MELDPVDLARMSAAALTTRLTAAVFGCTKAAIESYRVGELNHSLCASTREAATSPSSAPSGAASEVVTATRYSTGNASSACLNAVTSGLRPSNSSHPIRWPAARPAIDRVHGGASGPSGPASSTVTVTSLTTSAVRLASDRWFTTGTWLCTRA